MYLIMSMTPIHMNATISRVQDFTTVKQNEDQKPMVDQTNILHQRTKDVEDKQTTVHDADDSDQHTYNYDAKNKGNGTYEQNKRKKRQQEKQPEKKAEEPRSAFDVKI